MEILTISVLYYQSRSNSLFDNKHWISACYHCYYWSYWTKLRDVYCILCGKLNISYIIRSPEFGKSQIQIWSTNKIRSKSIFGPAVPWQHQMFRTRKKCRVDWASVKPSEIVWVVPCSGLLLLLQSPHHTVFFNTGNSKYPYFTMVRGWQQQTS